MVAEEKVFANIDFATGTDEAFPLIRILPELAGEENLDASVKKVAGSGITRTQRLRLKTGTTSIEASGKHACVVEDQEIVGAEKIGKIAKLLVAKVSGRGRKMKQARGRAVRQRLLRDQFGREFVIEIGDEHASRL